MLKLLLIDDNPKFNQNFAGDFSKLFSVDAYTDSEFLNIQKTLNLNNYDAVIIDLLMPAIDGISLWNQVKKDLSPGTRGFIISENFDSKNRELALKLGATDYLHKGMSTEEIFLRIQNRVTEIQDWQNSSETLENEDISLNLKDMSCNVNDNLILLTKTEFQILRFLLENLNEDLDRDKLIRFVWQKKEVRPQTLNSHIFNLNEKIKESVNHVSVSKNGRVFLKRKAS